MKGNNQLVAEVAKALGWTYEEAGNFMGHFVADNEDQLMADLEEACQWARDVEQEAALVSTMKQMPARSMKAKWNGGDMTLAINGSGDEEAE